MDRLITAISRNSTKMTEKDDRHDSDVLRANINNETSRINWNELQRFFAGGWLIYVSEQINLLDVAVAFSLDDKTLVSKWLTSGDIAKVSNEQAKYWHENNALFWANVVKPWVLIQPVEQDGVAATQGQDTEENKDGKQSLH